jgi:hypothetical protein
LGDLSFFRDESRRYDRSHGAQKTNGNGEARSETPATGVENPGVRTTPAAPSRNGGGLVKVKVKVNGNGNGDGGGILLSRGRCLWGGLARGALGT